MRKFILPDRSDFAQASAKINVQHVAQVLSKPQKTVRDLVALLSPAAIPFLERMAAQAAEITRRRFGMVMKLYAPLYLSSACENACRYCGFHVGQTIPRITLTAPQILEQAEFLRQQGFQSVLLVSGEAPGLVSLEYLRASVAALRPRFHEIALEVYPLPEAGYRVLAGDGVHALAIYQETYDQEIYAAMHPSGRKSDFHYRLETPARAGMGGLHQVSLGILLGLAPLAYDVFALASHAEWLGKQYWRTTFGFSFPRLRPNAGDFTPPHPVSDADFVQMVTALRVVFPDAPFSLSTREPEELRRRVLPLGFTQMSAGSSTQPGGYGRDQQEAEQFEVADKRPAHAVAAELRQLGFDPVWKDWDAGFLLAGIGVAP